jgi:hypothetical protein
MLDLARELGVHAYAVYHLLKSETWKGAPAVGVREIAETFRIGKDSAAKALRRLKKAGLVLEVPSRSVNRPSTWVVVHAKDAIEQRGQRPEVGTLRAKRKASERVPKEGHGVSLDKDARVLDQGRQRPQVGTPNKEVIPTPHLNTTAPHGARGRSASSGEFRGARKPAAREQLSRAAVGSAASWGRTG